MIRRSIPDDTIFSAETPEVAYWAGFLMADGGVARNRTSFVISLSLSTDDLDHLLKFRDFIGKRDDPGTMPQDMRRVAVGSKRLGDDLARWGVIPNKTYVGSIPSDIPQELIPHYIRGLIDGDGGIYIYRYTWTSWTIGMTNNETVIRQVAHILQDTLGISPYVFMEKEDPQTHHRTYGLKFSHKRDVRDAVIWLGYGGDGQAMTRKREKALEIIATDPRTIRNRPRTSEDEASLRPALICEYCGDEFRPKGRHRPNQRCCSASHAAHLRNRQRHSA